MARGFCAGGCDPGRLPEDELFWLLNPLYPWRAL